MFDYFNHAKFSDRYIPEIFLTPESTADHLWSSEVGVASRYNPMQADCLFVAGLDWNALKAFPGIENEIPVINLIQGIRHARPSDPLFSFLSKRAIRICVSLELADVLRQTRKCNGPVLAIPNGIDCSKLPKVQNPRDTDIFIAGIKQPGLARKLCEVLTTHGHSVDCIVESVERSEFLRRMASAQVAVTLPLAAEGFYLPALEAMMLGCALVCPDCTGNRGFCNHEETCLMPPAELDALAAAVQKLADDAPYRDAMVDRAMAKSAQFDIRRERMAFLEILNDV